MMTLVIYDVPDDKIRNRLAVACKDYGLQRVQWSAFLGFLNHNRREELQERLKRTLGRRTGNIQIYPLCDKDLRLRLEIEGVGGYRAPWRGEREGDPYAGEGADELAGKAGKGGRGGSPGYLFVGEEPSDKGFVGNEPVRKGSPGDKPADEGSEDEEPSEAEAGKRGQRTGGRGKAGKIGPIAHTVARTARKARSAT